MKPTNFISIFAKHTIPKFQWEKTRFFKANFKWRENKKLFSHPYFCQKTTQKRAFFSLFWAILRGFGFTWNTHLKTNCSTWNIYFWRHFNPFYHLFLPFIILFWQHRVFWGDFGQDFMLILGCFVVFLPIPSPFCRYLTIKHTANCSYSTPQLRLSGVFGLCFDAF